MRDPITIVVRAPNALAAFLALRDIINAAFPGTLPDSPADLPEQNANGSRTIERAGYRMVTMLRREIVRTDEDEWDRGWFVYLAFSDTRPGPGRDPVIKKLRKIRRDALASGNLVEIDHDIPPDMQAKLGVPNPRVWEHANGTRFFWRASEGPYHRFSGEEAIAEVEDEEA